MSDEIIPARPASPRERDRRIIVTARSEIRALDNALNTLPTAITAHIQQVSTLLRCYDRKRDLAAHPGAEGARGVAQGALNLVNLLIGLSGHVQALASELIDLADDTDGTPPEQRRPPELPEGQPPTG